MKIQLDARQMRTKEEAHTYLKESLELPEYYGNNLDALYDCLGDMDEEVIIELQNYSRDVVGSYVNRVLGVMQAAGTRVVLK